MRFVSSAVFLRFVDDLSENDIEHFLDEHKWFGTKVSQLMNRYVVEVPWKEEQESVEILASSPLVKRIHEITSGHVATSTKTTRKKGKYY